MAASDPPNQSMTTKMCLVCQKHFDPTYSICPHDQSNLVKVGMADSFIGKVIENKYRIIEEIGMGGMGTVYLAEEIGLDRHVAVKMLKAQLSEDKVSVQRFEQEASTSFDLVHPNLIRLYNFGAYMGKQPYLVMEYLQGRSLIQILREEGPLEPVRALKIFSQVIDGLHYAHQRGVVHRDVKPSNIIILEGENGAEDVRVVDFGLAKLMPWSGKESQHLTKTGEVFGSPIYMSPEQCMGKKLEPSSDIYSLGVTLFEALVGKPPFKGKNVVETASKHMNEPTPSFDSVRPDFNLSDQLQAVINKALEKEPVKRFLSLSEFKQALTQAITGPGANSGYRIGPPPQLSPDATQPVKRSDLDSLKSSVSSSKSTADLRNASGKKPVNPALVAGAVILIGATGGGIAWFAASGKISSNATEANIPATISYVRYSKNGTPSRIEELHVLVNNVPKVVKSKATIDDADYKLSLERRCLVDGDATMVKADNRKQSAYPPSVNLIERYYQRIFGNQDIRPVYRDLFSERLKKQFPGGEDDFAANPNNKVAACLFPSFTASTAKPQLNVVNEFNSHFKITNISPDRTTLIAEQSKLTKGGAPYVKFEIVRTQSSAGSKELKIDNITLSTKEEWNQY